MRVLSFVVGLFALIGFLVVAGAVTFAVVATRGGPDVPDPVVLELVIDGPSLPESHASGFDQLLAGSSTLAETIDTIDRAGSDPRVEGMVVRFGAEGVGLAAAQELRAAIERFRGSGRFALAYANTYGNATYALASACDQVWLQPTGLVGLTGPAIDVPFARAALDHLGVRPEFEQRERFKSAPNSLTEPGFTDAHREMTQALAEDLVGQLAEGVARSRGKETATVRALIDRAPLLDREAHEAGLIDVLGYRDEMAAEVERRAGGAAILGLDDYRAAVGPPEDHGPVIAEIHAVGAIADGEEASGPRLSVTPGTVVPAFDDAIEDGEVKAILLRIDSGGGSASASESIRRAVVRARQAGKPVVVSMGETAASGGYWIAMNANAIVATPATLTGSIGVFSGKLSVADLSERMGIAWGHVVTGRNAGMWTPTRPFSESERERLATYTDSIYEGFVSRVAEARTLPADTVRAIAGGRVWTGAQALKVGLIDELGGRDRALIRARAELGLTADAPVTIRAFPRSQTALEAFLEAIQGDRGLIDGVRSLAWLQTLASRLTGIAAGLTTTGAVARMPETRLR